MQGPIITHKMNLFAGRLGKKSPLSPTKRIYSPEGWVKSHYYRPQNEFIRRNFLSAKQTNGLILQQLTSK